MPRTNQGGKRPGGGHPTKVAQRHVLTDEDRAKGHHFTDEDRAKGRAVIAAQSHILEPAHLIAVKLRAQGYTWPRIAEKLEISRQTLFTWRSLSWWDEEFDKASREVMAQLDLMYQRRIGLSLEVNDKVMEDYIDKGENVGEAVKVSINIQDRAGGKPIIRSQNMSKKELHITYEEIAPQEQDGED